jgi:hypothetical protein
MIDSVKECKSSALLLAAFVALNILFMEVLAFRNIILSKIHFFDLFLQLQVPKRS